jgi:subtilisin family serine protease
VFSQNIKINLALKIALEKESNKDSLYPLFIVGDAPLIKLEVNRLKGEIIRSAKDIVQVKLPINTIEEFSKNEFVRSIPYSFSKGVVLSDTMTIHNNITPVHNGLSPLLESYTGKGVVYGIVDTGNDLDHPDFKDVQGKTRIYRILDQKTGITWDSTSINNGSCTQYDYHYNNHGTHVAGIGCGNGLGVGMYGGVAPEATIVVVASDFTVSNWLPTLVDAIDYIYAVADSLNMPCVINVSAGTYFGSHDGTDPAALLIDSIVNHKPGRALVCAAGNAGHFNWHIGQTVTSDTSLTWLKYNPSSIFGFGSVFYEVWSDTADFNNVNYAFGANLPSGSFEERGRTSFVNIQNRLGNYTDTIKNGSNILGIVQTYAELQGDKYLLQVLLNEPDSNTYNFSILSTGSGKFDFWSDSLFGTSDIVEASLPTVAQYPPIQYYTKPDSAQTIVSSFSCSPNIITVANFVNRKSYIDVDTIFRVIPETAGEKGFSSSIGPDRRGNIKPDIGATGDFTFGPNSTAVIAANMGAGPTSRAKVALGGMHRLNGGTSMASPVVAGVAALYLQKCPNATMAEIKTAITATAKQDNFTGTVPNPVFGNGKIDAFAALNISNYSFSLGDYISICGSDSAQVTSPPFISYLWSTLETTQSIFVNTPQSIYLTVTNGSGCKGVSDTVDAVWRPLPTKPVITHLGDDTLIYVTNLDLQWYYNSSAIVGATDTLHKAQNIGDYYVQVTDSFGCSNNSDTVTVLVVGIEEIKNNNISIYPNPTTGKITIELSDKEIRSIAIVNLLGETLFHRKRVIQESKMEFDISNFAEGVYYISLISSDKKYLQKLILLR